MVSDEETANFLLANYPENFFSHIIIDNCHREVNVLPEMEAARWARIRNRMKQLNMCKWCISMPLQAA
jgi:hypothetical protein